MHTIFNKVLVVVLLISMPSSVRAAQIETRAQKGLKRKLFEAIEEGDYHEVKKLVKLKVNINRMAGDCLKEDHYNWITRDTTPLMHAFHRNQREIITELVKAGADLEQQDNEGFTVLMLAIYADMVRIIQEKTIKGCITPFLIKLGAHVNAQRKDGFTPLTAVAHSCDLWRNPILGLQLAGILVKAGAEWNHANINTDAIFTAEDLNGWIKQNLLVDFVNYRKKVIEEVDKRLLPELAPIVADYVMRVEDNKPRSVVAGQGAHVSETQDGSESD